MQSIYRGLDPVQKIKHNHVLAKFFGIKLLANTYDYTFDFKSHFSESTLLLLTLPCLRDFVH